MHASDARLLLEKLHVKLDKLVPAEECAAIVRQIEATAKEDDWESIFNDWWPHAV